MAISDELTKLQTNLSNAYTSCNNKGATMPSSRNFDNLANTIDSIETGSGGSSSLYGLTINDFLGTLDENGVCTGKPSKVKDISFDGLVSIGSSGLSGGFNSAHWITGSVTFPDLISIGRMGLTSCFSGIGLTSVTFSTLTKLDQMLEFNSTFNGCTSLTSVSFPALISVSGTSGFSNTFNGCTSLTSVSFPALTSLSGTGTFPNTFYGCTSLTSVSFPALTSVSGTSVFTGIFTECSSLTDIYFNSLTTSISNNSLSLQNIMSNSGTGCIHTIHFPSNLESSISKLIGYPNFGGTSGYVQLAFDLPAT